MPPQLTVSNDGVSLSGVRFIFHLIVRVLGAMILSKGSVIATKERLQDDIRNMRKNAAETSWCHKR